MKNNRLKRCAIVLFLLPALLLTLISCGSGKSGNDGVRDMAPEEAREAGEAENGGADTGKGADAGTEESGDAGAGKAADVGTEESGAADSGKDAGAAALKKDDPGSEKSLASRLTGRYSAALLDPESGEETEEVYSLEILDFHGNLYGFGGFCYGGPEEETLDPYSFYAIEFLPTEAGILQRTDADSFEAGLLFFSVQSNLGQYQGVPSVCEISLTDGGISISGAGEKGDPLTGMPGKLELLRDERVSSTFPYVPEGASFPGNPGESGLDGLWRQEGVSDPLYLEFRDGAMQYYRKAPGTEVKFGRGKYILDGLSAGTAAAIPVETGTVSAFYSILDTAGMPLEWEAEYRVKGDTLIFTEGYEEILETVPAEEREEPGHRLTLKRVSCTELPLIRLCRPDDLEAIGGSLPPVKTDGAERPVLPQFAEAEEVENNGGHFVKIGDLVFFREYGEGLENADAAWGDFLGMRAAEYGKGSRLCWYDTRTGETGSACEDGGFGPLYYMGGKFISEISGEDTGNQVLASFYPDGSGRRVFSEGRYSSIGAVSGSGRHLCVHSYGGDEGLFIWDGTAWTQDVGLDPEETVTYAAFVGEDLIYLVNRPDGSLSGRADIFQFCTDSGEKIFLGTLPGSEWGDVGYPNVRQLLTEEDRICLGVAWYDGSALDIQDYVVLQMTSGEEESLRVLDRGIPEGFGEGSGRRPMFYLDAEDELRYTSHSPSGEAALSEGSYGDLIYYDSPFGAARLIPDFIPDSPFHASEEGDEVRILQTAEYVDGAVYTVTADAAYAPEKDLGWRMVFDLKDLTRQRIQVESVESRGGENDFAAEPLGPVNRDGI